MFVNAGFGDFPVRRNVHFLSGFSVDTDQNRSCRDDDFLAAHDVLDEGHTGLSQRFDKAHDMKLVVQVGFFTEGQFHLGHQEPWRILPEACKEMRTADLCVRTVREVVDMPEHIGIGKTHLELGACGTEQERFFHDGYTKETCCKTMALACLELPRTSTQQGAFCATMYGQFKRVHAVLCVAFLTWAAEGTQDTVDGLREGYGGGFSVDLLAQPHAERCTR